MAPPPKPVQGRSAAAAFMNARQASGASSPFSTMRAAPGPSVPVGPGPFGGYLDRTSQMDFARRANQQQLDAVRGAASEMQTAPETNTARAAAAFMVPVRPPVPPTPPEPRPQFKKGGVVKAKPKAAAPVKKKAGGMIAKPKAAAPKAKGKAMPAFKKGGAVKAKGKR